MTKAPEWLRTPFCNLQEQNEPATPMPQVPDVPESLFPVNGNPTE